MLKNKRKIDALPERFNSLEQASDFWDTHDAGDYKEYLKPIHEKVELAANMPFTVSVEHDLAEKLKQIARKRGISLEKLVNLWLKDLVKTT